LARLPPLDSMQLSPHCANSGLPQGVTQKESLKFFSLTEISLWEKSLLLAKCEWGNIFLTSPRGAARRGICQRTNSRPSSARTNSKQKK
jgi:hypothetical protein